HVCNHADCGFPDNVSLFQDTGFRIVCDSCITASGCIRQHVLTGSGATDTGTAEQLAGHSRYHSHPRIWYTFNECGSRSDLSAESYTGYGKSMKGTLP